jgi:translocation and assembly module TamB
LFNTESKRPPVIDTLVKIDTTQGWNVVVGDANLKQVFFKMDNNNVPRIASGMDYSHLDIRQLDFSGKKLFYNSDTMRGQIQHLSMQEQCGFNLKELRTDFAYYSHGAYLHNLYFQTPGTLLQNFAEIRYASTDILQKHPGFIQLKINLVKSQVDANDVLLFAPQLKDQKFIAKYKNRPIKLEANMNGFVNALDIKNFYFAGLDNTEVQLSGKLNGLPDVKRINYDLRLAKLSSTSNDVNSFLTDSIIALVRIPDHFSISGNIKGTQLSYNPDLTLISTDGSLILKGMLDISKSKGAESYDMKITSQALNVGHIIRKDSLIGIITTDLYAKGNSFDIKTMNAIVNGNIQAAKISGYNYNLITFDGKIANHIGEIKLVSNDTNAHLQLNCNFDFTNKFAAVKTDLNIDNLDLQALKLYTSPLNVKGLIHSDIPVLDPDYPNGILVWRNPAIISSGKKYATDSLYIVSTSKADSGQNIKGELNALHFILTGKTPLTKIGNILVDHLNRHYQFKRDSAKQAEALAKQYKTDTTLIPADYDLALKANIENTPFLQAFIPDLTSLKPINITAALSPRFINMDADVPQVQYNGISIDNAKAIINGTDSAFDYKITIDQISQNKLQLWYTNISGELDKDQVSTNISIADADKKEQFALSATLSLDSNTQVLHLAPKLKLNYEAWQVSDQNKIVFSSKGFYAQDFKINYNNESIALNSQPAEANAPLNIDFNDFYLDDISRIMSRDTTLIAGALTGNVKIEKWSPGLAVSGSLKIQGLTIMQDTLGNLSAEITSTDANAINAKIGLQGHGNDVSITGAYYLKTNNGNDFNGDVELNPLNISSIEGLAQHQIKHSSGSVSGKLHVQGTTTAPAISGDLTTNNVITTISQLNSQFKFPSNKIEFSNEGASVNNFEILDSSNNKAVISGQLVTKDLTDIRMDLKVNADNWRAVHSTSGDNKVFYGDLFLSTNMTAKGSVTQPNIDGELKILKSTKITYVMPDKNPELESTAGIVEFINTNDTGEKEAFVPKKAAKDSAKVQVAPGSNMNVNVTIDKSAEFNIVIDEAAGDFIRVKGDASLNTSTNSNGDFLLTGTYELHEGEYQMNYNFIKRKFAIQDGSSIIFAGDPLKAKADITAIYEADVPPYDLVQREVADQSQLNYYKEKLPFNVELHLKGSMLQPLITFNIVLPDNKVYPLSADQIELVQGKLNQVRSDTTELNKQVFALLILSRFVSDNPFASSSGGSVSNTAIESVSGFIGQQLNKLTGNLIKGVDLTADLATTEDYTTGEMQDRTDLNIAASKRLMNDRLKLTVGNDFELQGPQPTNSNENSYIPSNLAADYLLTQDGKYTLRAYRKNYDAGVLEGYITQSGLDFIVSLDYNHFKNIFKKENTTEQNTPLKQ